MQEKNNPSISYVNISKSVSTKLKPNSAINVLIKGKFKNAKSNAFYIFFYA